MRKIPLDRSCQEQTLHELLVALLTARARYRRQAVNLQFIILCDSDIIQLLLIWHQWSDALHVVLKLISNPNSEEMVKFYTFDAIKTWSIECGVISTLLFTTFHSCQNHCSDSLQMNDVFIGIHLGATELFVLTFASFCLNDNYFHRFYVI